MSRPIADRPLRPFDEWLHDHAQGRTLDVLTEQLAELVSAVQDTGKAGTLSLKIKVAPNPGDEQMVIVTDEVKLLAPLSQRPASLFYVDENCGLRRTDPRQMTLVDI